MPAFIPEYSIAAGHNNAAGLTEFSSLTDTNGVKLVMPRAIPYRMEGQLKISTNGVPAYDGYDSQDFEFKVLLVAQYELLRDTYTGLVTIRTALDGATFANYNASAWIDEKTAGQYGYAQGSAYTPNVLGPALQGIRLHCIKLEAL
jgi:hypothetical protein